MLTPFRNQLRSAQRFAENDITFVILPDLTDQDLEKIGFASLGIGVSYCAPSPN